MKNKFLVTMYSGSGRDRKEMVMAIKVQHSYGDGINQYPDYDIVLL